MRSSPRILLVPSESNELFAEDQGYADSDGSDNLEKPSSFAKTLTQSDANNGGGFSVSRYCAETIFPRLDYSTDLPMQTVVAKDIYDEVWKFWHIYRGAPCRHLLMTGWSMFVNQKKLVTGDSIVFLRAQNGDLCVEIWRAKQGSPKGSSESGWNHSGYRGASVFRYSRFSVFLKWGEIMEREIKKRETKLQ